MTVRPIILAIAIGAIAYLSFGNGRELSPALAVSTQPTLQTLQPNSLCATNERVIFSCPLKRPAKIVSLCSSKDLTSDRGYLQYRFGLPGKIELEYPKVRTGTQEKFQYTHYFRARVDLTEITFTAEGYEYKIYDDYNGEEKRVISVQGIAVSNAGVTKADSVCRAKPKADYADLQAVLASNED